MARDSSSRGNNSGASDREMERVLREHFETESPDLRMSKDPWDWLQNRMDEPEKPSLPSRIMNRFSNMWKLRPGPVFSAAGAAAVVLVAIFVTLNVLIDSGPGNQLDLMLPIAAVPEDFERVGTTVSSAATAAPAPTMAPTAAPTMAPTAAPTETITISSDELLRAAVQAAAATAAPATAAPTMAPRAMPTAAPTPTRQRFMPAPTMAPTAAARPTIAPASEPRPTQASPRGTPPSTTFRDYQRERFVSAAVDNVSTFSLDTDRTSYFLALNWARNGYEVDPDSVRAEEWVNAFNYGYEQPRRDDSFAISTDVVTHPLDSRTHLARIAFQAPELDYDTTPVNVTLVLDASGSMADGNRVDIAREAAESIRLSLRDHDRIAVVHFSQERPPPVHR